MDTRSVRWNSVLSPAWELFKMELLCSVLSFLNLLLHKAFESCGALVGALVIPFTCLNIFFVEASVRLPIG